MGRRVKMGTAATHAKRRNELRKRLRARGYDEATIEAVVAAKAEDQRRMRETAAEMDRRLARVREQEAALDARTAPAEWEPPADDGYKPKQVDSLLTGPARVSGLTAKAARRRSTLTKWEHDQAADAGRPGAVT